MGSLRARHAAAASMTANSARYSIGRNSMGPVRRWRARPGPYRAANRADRPRWWGRHFDSITYLVLEAPSTTDAPMSAILDQLTIAARTKGIRSGAPGPSWSLTNGAPGSILAERCLAIRHRPIHHRQVAQYGLTSDPVPPRASSPAILLRTTAWRCRLQLRTSEMELDALGWRRSGAFRAKDGRQLLIRD